MTYLVFFKFVWESYFRNLAFSSRGKKVVRLGFVAKRLLLVENVSNFFLSFFSGDEIFSINSVPVQGMTHGEAIGLFKEVKKGPIVVTIGRRAAAASTTSLSLKPASSNLIATTHEVEE